MRPEKISGSLAESIQSPQDEDLEVIVELSSPTFAESGAAGREQKIAARKEAFVRYAEPVVERIRGLGGEVTGQAWINSSLRARVPKSKVAELSAEGRVSRIDLPHKLQAEG